MNKLNFYIAVIFIFSSLLALTACGQKGSLYLPEQPINYYPNDDQE